MKETLAIRFQLPSQLTHRYGTNQVFLVNAFARAQKIADIRFIMR